VPPNTDTPTGPLTGFWRAAPGAYVAPFNQFGLNPNSTNLTVYNPRPVRNATVRVPVIMTVPNAASQRTRPATGWPLVIYQHGITRNRVDSLAVSGTLAQAGFAMVAIDQPLHGVSPGSAGFESIAPFYINPNNPLMAGLHAAGVRERTFDVDYIDNATGAAGPDGIPDPSGAHTINLASLLTSRDNLRQATADLFVLTASVPNMTVSGGAGDFDSSRVHFVGHSLGAIVGTPYLALEPKVDVGMLSSPGGGIAQMLLNGSATFAPRTRAGLAAAGVHAGTPAFDQFLGALQQVADSADPINYGFASVNNAILLHEVVGNGADIPGDLVVPVSVAGAPLAGTEPLIRVLGLPTITESVFDPNGVRGAVRFTQGEHSSLLSPVRTVGLEQPDPTGFMAVTQEMHRQMATFVGSDGTAVQVTDTSVIRTQ
jgi:pimeloyl-ACP methyl ester carboxylesterase